MFSQSFMIPLLLGVAASAYECKWNDVNYIDALNRTTLREFVTMDAYDGRMVVVLAWGIYMREPNFTDYIVGWFEPRNATRVEASPPGYFNVLADHELYKFVSPEPPSVSTSKWNDPPSASTHKWDDPLKSDMAARDYNLVYVAYPNNTLYMNGVAHDVSVEKWTKVNIRKNTMLGLATRNVPSSSLRGAQSSAVPVGVSIPFGDENNTSIHTLTHGSALAESNGKLFIVGNETGMSHADMDFGNANQIEDSMVKNVMFDDVVASKHWVVAITPTSSTDKTPTAMVAHNHSNKGLQKFSKLALPEVEGDYYSFAVDDVKDEIYMVVGTNSSNSTDFLDFNLKALKCASGAAANTFTLVGALVALYALVF